MRIWGCHIYIIHNSKDRQKLDPTGFLGYFMKFSSSSKIAVYYNPTTKCLGRSSNIYFDELNIGANTKMPAPGQSLMDAYPDLPITAITSQLDVNLQSFPFCQDPIVTYTIQLPPKTIDCIVKFYDDDAYGIPYIRSLASHHPIGRQLPPTARTQQWLLALGSEEPIHATSATDELTWLLLHKPNTYIKIMLSRRYPA